MYTIYTKDGCSLCDDTKRYCKENNISYVETYLVDSEQIAAVKSLLPEEIKNGPVTLPIVFKDGTYIGGRNELIRDSQSKVIFQKETLKNLLKGNICIVEFRKKNGDLRRMKCTLKEESLPKRYWPQDSNRVENDNFLPVFDVELNEWRGFNLDSIKSFTILPKSL